MLKKYSKIIFASLFGLSICIVPIQASPCNNTTLEQNYISINDNYNTVAALFDPLMCVGQPTKIDNPEGKEVYISYGKQVILTHTILNGQEKEIGAIIDEQVANSLVNNTTKEKALIISLINAANNNQISLDKETKKSFDKCVDDVLQTGRGIFYSSIYDKSYIIDRVVSKDFKIEYDGKTTTKDVVIFALTAAR